MVKNSDAEIESVKPKNKKRRRSRKKKSQPEDQKPKTPAITEDSKHRKKKKKKSKEKEIKTSDEEDEDYGFRISNMVENSNVETCEQKKKNRKRKKKSQPEELKPKTPVIAGGSKHSKKKNKKSKEEIKTSDEEDEDYYVKRYPDMFVAEDMIENYYMELAQMHTSQEYMAFMSECKDPFLESSDGESLSEMLKYMHIVSDTDDHDTDGGKIDIKYYDGKPRSKRIEALESKEICNEVSKI